MVRITHAGGRQCINRVIRGMRNSACVSVRVSVSRILKGKQLWPSTPKLADIQRMANTLQTVCNNHEVKRSKVTLSSGALPESVCSSIQLLRLSGLTVIFSLTTIKKITNL